MVQAVLAHLFSCEGNILGALRDLKRHTIYELAAEDLSSGQLNGDNVALHRNN
jgi:hypothetical protein